MSTLTTERRMKKSYWAVALGLACAATLSPREAGAFCGFYVGGAGARMFNHATQVVLMRQGLRTVLSMENNYEEGFRRVRSTSFDEVCLDFTGTYDRERKFRFQGIAVASRGAALLP